MYKNGIKTVVMEVSAHAIYYEKIKGVKFYGAVFTNFTQDHLDFFGDMESYKQAKMKFFKQNKCKFVVTNSDDLVGVEISKLCRNSLTYGIENPADVFAINIEENKEGASFVINLFDCIYDVNLKLMGKFNVYNSLATASACALLGVKPKDVVDALNNCSCVQGRLEKIYDKEFKVYIDYAHTPDGLKNVLQTLRTATLNRLINVFGCGGNRDKGKRAIMGRISAENADITVITSDNPRYEEPMDIIRDVEKGVLETKKKYISIEDRKEAIFYALDMAKKGDCVIVSGKGSEKYQEVLGIKKLYNDKDTIKEYFRGKNN
jgi:UDP-N-acetylmuramoyl-L-alanyl-D-glutamate--2,6-diaminopimelate ligase